MFSGVDPVEVVPRPDGLITVEQAALLCDVTPAAVRHWVNRGYDSRDGHARHYLPVAKRLGRAILLDPREVAKAEWATRKRARRGPAPVLAAAA